MRNLLGPIIGAAFVGKRVLYAAPNGVALAEAWKATREHCELEGVAVEYVETANQMRFPSGGVIHFQRIDESYSHRDLEAVRGVWFDEVSEYGREFPEIRIRTAP